MLIAATTNIKFFAVNILFSKFGTDKKANCRKYKDTKVNQFT